MPPQEAVSLAPSNAEYLSCLSKQWSDLVFIPGTSDDDARTYARTAIKLAEQACITSPSIYHTIAAYSSGAYVDVHSAFALVYTNRHRALGTGAAFGSGLRAGACGSMRRQVVP